MGNELKIIEPEIQDLQTSSTDMLSQAGVLTVKDDASFSLGGEMLLEIKRRSKVVEERFAEPVSLAHKAHKALTSLRDSVLGPFKQAEITIKGKLGVYQQEVERKRQQEAERLRKQAEAKAEADRIAKAEEQMDKGDLEGCKQTLEAPIAPVVITPPTPEPPKVAGVSFREDWKYEVVNPDLIPREYMMVDEIKLRRIVKAMGKAASNIPGIRVYAEKVVSAGRSA